MKNKGVRKKLESSILTTEDWNELEELDRILEKFRAITGKLEGIYAIFFN